VYPLLTAGVTPGVCVPQVNNHCNKGLDETVVEQTKDTFQKAIWKGIIGKKKKLTQKNTVPNDLNYILYTLEAFGAK